MLCSLYLVSSENFTPDLSSALAGLFNFPSDSFMLVPCAPLSGLKSLQLEGADAIWARGIFAIPSLLLVGYF